MQKYADGNDLDESLFAKEYPSRTANGHSYANGDSMDASLFAKTSSDSSDEGGYGDDAEITYERRQEGLHPLRDALGESLSEGAKGAGRAVKAIGGGFVGLASGAVRLSGTVPRIFGWDGLHKLADSIDAGYENFGSDALESDYGLDKETNIGTVGEKMAGIAGSLGGLGAAGKAIGVAGKLAGGGKVATGVAKRLLPAMFGNDAAVRAYDTARMNEKSKGEAASLAALNGLIHYAGFRLFDNAWLSKTLRMGPETEAKLSQLTSEAMSAGTPKTYTELVDGIRKGIRNYTLAERAKGAIRAGGIMSIQDALSDIPMQVAEGKDWDDLDYNRIVEKGAHGLGEGGFMEGSMALAGMMLSGRSARKFVADKFYRGKDYKVAGPDGRTHDEPGILNSPAGRMFLMKQNPDATERVLDIVEHGGKPRADELDAAFLPPDMTKEELEKFAKAWRKDLEPYVEEAYSADSSVRPQSRRAEADMDVANADENAGRILSAEEARAQGEQEPAQELPQAQGEAGTGNVPPAPPSAPAGAEPPSATPTPPPAEPTARPQEQPTAQEAPNEAGNGADEAPAQHEQGAEGRPAEGQAVQPVEAPAQPEPPPPEVVDRPNRLRRQQPNNFRHPGDNRLRPAVPDIDQQPIRETNDETWNGADEAPAQQADKDAGPDGQQSAPQAGARPVEGAAPRGEVPAAGEVKSAGTRDALERRLGEIVAERNVIIDEHERKTGVFAMPGGKDGERIMQLDEEYDAIQERLDAMESGESPGAEAPNAGVVEPISAKKMRAMNYENVIALPDSWQKYSELQSRLMRTGDKGGVSVESPAGKQIKAEMERMDADGWGDLYRAKMKWAGADRKTRGEHPPDTLEAFKEWQAAKSSAPTVPTEPKPKTNRGQNLRGLTYEDYGSPPNLDPETRDADSGGTGDVVGASLLRYARQHDGILYVPRGWNAYRKALGQWKAKRARGIVDGRPRPKMKDFGVTDPLADWLESVLDGNSKDTNAIRKTLFGFNPREGSNDGTLDDAPAEIQAIYDRAEEDGVPGTGRIAVAEALLEARQKYAEWAAERREARRGKGVKQTQSAQSEQSAAEEEDNYYDFDELFAAKDAMDEEFANALGVIEGAGPTDYAILSPTSLRNAAQGDTIRFDHDAEAFAFESFDPEGGVLTIVDYDVAADTETRRRYRITENSIEEIDNGPEEEAGADEDRPGNEEGPAGGGGQGQGQGGEDFALESATAEELKAEKERQRQRDEVRRRQNAPLETGTGEVGQTLLDLGGAEGEDLFSRTQRTGTNRLRNAAGEDPLAARGQGAAPSAENVSAQATSKNDASPSNSDVASQATWTDRGGTTHVLDGFDVPSSDNVAKGAHVAIRHDNGVLYQGEIVGIGPKNVKVKTQSDMYGETVLTFPRKDIVGVRSQTDRARQNTERTEGDDVAALTAKAQALAAEYAALPDREKVSAKGRDLEQRIAEAWDAVDAAEMAENAPVAAPKKTGATTLPKAVNPAEGVESDSSATPTAPTPEMRRKATAAMRILGADAGEDAAALEAELRRMEERGQAESGPGRRRAEALRDLAAYKRAVGTKEVSAEEIAEGRQRDAEQRIIEGRGDTLPSEDFYGRRQSRGNGEMPAKWTDAAKKPLERVAHALRNVVTIGGKKLKVTFADRPEDVDGDTRKSIGGIYTGTTADYANRSRQGGKDDGPSLVHIGTGEGSQVYGWGLYGSTVRGVAETYAKNIKEGKYTEVRYKGRTLDEDAESDLIAIGSAVKYVADHPKEATGVEDYYGKMIATYEDRGELYKPYAEAARRQLETYKADPGAWKAEKPREQVYEQTFFTDRAPGDESHLLKWYEPVSEEQIEWVAQAFRRKGHGVVKYGTGKWNIIDRYTGDKTMLHHESGEKFYEGLSTFLGSPKAASEFLARAGIDGVKYPVDSYGGKGVKDGDKAGWNYVSFRDDNIRVDHKWTDGEKRYMRNGDGEVVGEYDGKAGTITLYPGATVADVVHEFTHPLVDFARAEAKAGRGELLGKIKEIIDAERATWEKPVRDAYADKGEGEILEEIFTHAMGDKGATLFGKSTTTLEGRRWYNRLWEAIKGVWQDFATKMGWNKADLRGLDGVSPEDAAQKILSEMAKGRSFGDAVTGRTERAGGGAKNAAAFIEGGRKRLSQISNDTTPDIRYSRRVTPSNVPPAPTNQDIQDYLGGKDGFMRRLRRMFQDKNIVIRDVEERLGVTDKDASVYYAKDRAFGKNEHELTVLQKQEVEPIVEKIHKSGGSLDLFSAYLYARHSGERNAALKASRGVENGSGMTKEQADTIFNAVDRLGLRAAFEDAARDVWAMNRKYLQRRVDSGRMTQADYDFYTQKYKHYVPLRTDMTDEELDIFNSTTGGWKRNELMAAQGRRSAADDPLAFSIVQNEQAIRASNANEVRRRFAGLVRRSNGTLGEVVDGVNKGGAKWSFTFGDGETVETGSQMRLASERDDIVLFKENGQLKAAKVNPGEHGRGLDLARAVTDKDVAQFNRHLEWIPRATRWMSAMRTQYVPTFIVRNMKADNLEVLLNVLSERGVKDGAKFFGKFLKNEVSVAKGVKEYFKTGKSSDRLVQEAVENGLLTGGGMSAEGFTETARRLSDTLQALRERPKILGGAFEAAKDTISLLNACAEYNTRMGVYKTLRQEGMSVADAVSYARDVTVNFNRKGYLTPYTNAAFMFSNAAIQGMGRAFKSMNSAHGKEVLAGMFLVGVAQALLDDWLGHDDESEKSGGADSRNLTEYDKSHSLGVALPTGHRVKTGIRNPWALPMYAGRKAVELLKGISSGEKVMKDLASEVGQFVTEPVGGNGFDSTSEFLQTLAPTIIDPFVQWGTGKDYRGQDRLKKSFDKYAPDSWNGKDSTPEAYKAIAKALNFISGGSEHRKGAFDVAPENLRLLTETVFGGVLTDLNNLVKGGEHAVDAVRGKPAAQIARDIPFARDTFTNMPDNTSRFYAALDAYNADKAEFKKTTELGRRRDMKREKPYFTQGKGRVDTLIERVKELRHLERGEVKAGQKWVERKTPVPEERKRRFREQRLATQARVLKMLGE